ncbi:MAG TPA: sigma-70 family RNA polymerase sigma factor [Pseudonocardiaceae bacterium]|jgi:RNA polymerase sigma-70 factor (ECF subfamily)|nr:sigma-70 family RNA polymerase sigma factor [Pseudonocardiaceae bacterium]
MDVWVRRSRGEQEQPIDGEEDVASPPRLHVVGAQSYPDWEAIYRDNVGRVYRIMFDKVGNRPDAEDLTTEVFLAALKPLRTSASVGEVRAYLLTTARTVLASYWRRVLGRELTTLDDEVAEQVFDDIDPDRSERADAILAELPENYRQVLQLRFLHGRSCKDVADEMNVTVGNVKVLQHRALRAAAKVAERIGV